MSDRAWDIAECRKALAQATEKTHGFQISRDRMESLIAEIDELTATRDTWREVATAREADYGKVASELAAARAPGRET